MKRLLIFKSSWEHLGRFLGRERPDLYWDPFTAMSAAAPSELSIRRSSLGLREIRTKTNWGRVLFSSGSVDRRNDSKTASSEHRLTVVTYTNLDQLARGAAAGRSDRGLVALAGDVDGKKRLESWKKREARAWREI